MSLRQPLPLHHFLLNHHQAGKIETDASIKRSKEASLSLDLIRAFDD